MIFTCNSIKLTWIESYNTYLLGIQSPIAQDVLIYTLWDRSSHGYFHQTLSSDGVLGELGVNEPHETTKEISCYFTTIVMYFYIQSNFD